MLDYESKAKNQGYRLIVGIDEAGRGPLAGPVVASAVLLRSFDFTQRIDDSKKLSPKQRRLAFDEIKQNGYVGLGQVSELMIDKINILQATYLAMSYAVNDLITKLPVDVQESDDLTEQVCLLVDGNRFQTTLPYKHWSIVDGDARSLSIACASIIAKVTRDEIVDGYDETYPEYGFRNHKGYGTKQHREAIKKYGLLDIHRKSFNVRI